MLPVQHAYFPIERDPDYQTEIGAGITAVLALEITEEYLLSARIQRWRGTKTDKFHAFETAIGFNRRL